MCYCYTGITIYLHTRTHGEKRAILKLDHFSNYGGRIESQISGLSGRLEAWERGSAEVQVQRSSAGRSPFCSEETQAFVLSILQLVRSGPPTSWKAICFSQSPLIQVLISPNNILTETSRITFDQIPGHCGPIELTCKIN